MLINIIAAVSNNNVIGKDNKLPWHLPEDLKYFREKTYGKIIVMGRKTCESLCTPLPGRYNIVLSRDSSFHVPGFKTIASVEDLLIYAKFFTSDSIFIIGGSVIYNEFIDIADNLFITEIDINCEGDSYFPRINPSIWKKKSDRLPIGALTSKHEYRFIHYKRKH